METNFSPANNSLGLGHNSERGVRPTNSILRKAKKAPMRRLSPRLSAQLGEIDAILDSARIKELERAIAVLRRSRRMLMELPEAIAVITRSIIIN